MSLDNGSSSAAAAFHNSELVQKSADQRIQCGIYRAGVITHIKMEQECTTILDFGLWDLTFPFGACSIGLSENGVRLNSLVYHDFDYKKCQKRRCTYVYPILRHTQVWLYIYIYIISQYYPNMCWWSHHFGWSKSPRIDSTLCPTIAHEVVAHAVLSSNSESRTTILYPRISRVPIWLQSLWLQPETYT